MRTPIFARWRETLGLRDCPMTTRWRVVTPWFSLRLHHLLPDGEDAHPHDHRWAFVTLVLRGGYDDLVPCPNCRGCERVDDPDLVALYEAQGALDEDDEERLTRGQCWMPCPTCHTPDRGPIGEVVGDRLRAGALRYRSPLHVHRTSVLPEGAWTLVCTGPTVRPWYFVVNGARLTEEEYREKFGDPSRCVEDRAA
jgi:hypothetical protein